MVLSQHSLVCHSRCLLPCYPLLECIVKAWGEPFLIYIDSTLAFIQVTVERTQNRKLLLCHKLWKCFTRVWGDIFSGFFSCWQHHHIYYSRVDTIANTQGQVRETDHIMACVWAHKRVYLFRVVCVCVDVCVCVWAYVCACVCVWMHVCVFMCAFV